MEYLVKVTSTYAVCCPEGGELTDDKGMKETLEAGKQYHFTAQSGKWYTTAPITLTKCSTFKRAASALGLLGGGVKSDLPAGYLACDFIYSNKNGQTTIPFVFSSEGHRLDVTTEHLNTSEEEFQGEFNYNLQMGIYNKTSFFMNLGDGFALAGCEFGKWNTCTYSVDNKTLTISAKGKTRSGEKAIYASVDKFTLFYGRGAYPGYKRRFILAVDNVIRYNLKPAISPLGSCIWHDSVAKKDYAATQGVYSAGLTHAQARKLGKHLPEGGGSLTISLPTGYEQDSAVAESLETARANGWTLTVQTYEAEAAAATFGMRRVWVRRVQDEQGGYVDADGVRWAVEWCVDMVTPDGSTPDQHGYELYRSTEAAVAYWELSAWVDPEAEELLTTESL